MNRHCIIAVAVLLVLSVAVGGANAEGGIASVNGGISGLTGDGSEYWNIGFTGGVNGFYQFTPYVLFGGRISYSRWTPDEDKLISDLPYTDIEWDISGSLSSIEIAPSLRLLVPMNEETPVRPFAQLGVGLYLLSADANIEATYLGDTYNFSSEESENKVGVSFGAGVDIKFIEILPMYTIVATEGESTKYYSINVGAAFPF
jgi:hypothetical protein